MAQTDLITWPLDSSVSFRRVGIDAESPERVWSLLCSGGRPGPHVFSSREVAHNRTLPDAAAGFCACFCTKEALFKALNRSYNYLECELFLNPAAEEQELHLSPALQRECGIGASLAKVVFPGTGECLAAVFLSEKHHAVLPSP